MWFTRAMHIINFPTYTNYMLKSLRNGDDTIPPVVLWAPRHPSTVPSVCKKKLYLCVLCDVMSVSINT